MAKSLPEYPIFNPTDTPKDAAAWDDWLEGFLAMLDAMQVQDDAPAVVDAANEANNVAARTERYRLLWHYIGQDCRKRLKKCDNNGIENASFTQAHTALTRTFSPTLNRLYQMHVVHGMKQGEAESMDSFYVKVKDEVDKMRLNDLNVQQIIELIILSQLVNNTSNPALTRKAIKDNQSLQRFRNTARTTELTEQQLSGMHQQPEVTNYVRKKTNKDSRAQQRSKQTTKHWKSQDRQSERPENRRHEKQRKHRCDYCGETCIKGKCPAFGQTCGKCGKPNHVAKVCKSSKDKHIRQLDDFDEELDSEDSIYHVTQQGKKSQYFAKLQVSAPSGEKVIKFQLDTGASCSTMTVSDYQKITSEAPRQSNARLRLYDGTVINPVGCATFQCKAKDTRKKIHFEIVREAPMSLLSANACAALKLITFNEQLVCQVTSSTVKPLTKDEVLTSYADVFKGLGKLPGNYHIAMDHQVQPVQNNPRRVPVPVRKSLEDKLRELTEQGILEKVTVPTPWISNMVVVQKPNKLRVCLDPNKLNTAIQRNHYPTPTLEDMVPKLSKARIFSVVDAKDGFLQVELDEESSFLTTFWTPFGRYRWLRMPFGLKSAPEEFQRRLDACLEGLQNTLVIADDILIFGAGDTEEEAVRSHDAAMRALLQRCKEKNLKLNKKKLRFKMDEVSYMGHRLTVKGLSPCPEKIKAVAEMERPKDIAGVQRLIGVVTYLAKFLPRLSTVCEPMRRLTDKEAVFDWLPQHEEAFTQIKKLITNAPILQYYDYLKDVKIECDSSDVGLGAVLLQEGQPVAFASRALTKTERNYAQIEKECLSIVFATERFEHYILGKEKVTVENDHKPLMTIFKKSILSSPKRLQRMRLRLMKYNLEVIYKPGPQMYISDTLSRASLPLPKVQPRTPEYLIYAIRQAKTNREELEQLQPDNFVTDLRLLQIKRAMINDPTLQTLVSVTAEGWPNSKQDVPLCIRDYWPYRDELTVHDGLAYRGTRIIMPTSLRREMIERAHLSHLGEQYTINTAREIMYWPQMHQDLVEAVKTCNICQEDQPAQVKETLMTYPIPQLPWQVVASDIFELQGKHYLVIVDTYSDYIELCSLTRLTAENLIECMKQVFSTHGVPMILISDNGPNYASRQFTEFAAEWKFQHVTSSPHHHKSNGKAESAVKIIKRVLKRAKRGNIDKWAALLEWRNTTTPNMSSSPSQRLLSRRTRSLLPCALAKYAPEIQLEVPKQIKAKRQTSKTYHDKAGAKDLPKLVIGQPVRVKTHPQKSGSNWLPGQVLREAAPRSYIVEVNGRNYRRNRIHLRDTLKPTVVREEPTITPPVVRDVPATTEVPATPRAPQPLAARSTPMSAKTPPVAHAPNGSSTPRRITAATKTTRCGRAVKAPARFQE